MISLADQLRRIEQGALTPEAALAESLAAIDAQEVTIKAFVTRAKNPKAQTKGPLRGIAVGHQGHHRYGGYADRNGRGDL